MELRVNDENEFDVPEYINIPESYNFILLWLTSVYIETSYLGMRSLVYFMLRPLLLRKISI
jgi:hypothetical protein